MALADLVNVILSDYGNATGATFDLTDISNLASMEGGGIRNQSSSNMTTMIATPLVDVSAYQSAQYLANNIIIRLFNDMLRPLTTSVNTMPAGNDLSAGINNATGMAQEEGQMSATVDNTDATINLDRLEAGLIQLRDDINSRAAPNQIMTTAHLGIQPVIMQTYGLTIENKIVSDTSAR